MTERTAEQKRNEHRIPGYKPVLLREVVKSHLRDLRHRLDLGNDSHLERCMVSGGMRMLLEDPALHKKWLDYTKEELSEDFKLRTERNLSDDPKQRRGQS
ncbi:hypothetical protein [Cupriavidus malaysiensis]|uniref:hypothetical protein n=1 Tax=Cupriavidus malaysiensis TaxID=367825 RepID=UPI0012FFBFFA|nr:hypothetical protein [Cupriavidus malaysiensis]